jgi:sugar lactone lactonase YvrE
MAVMLVNSREREEPLEPVALAVDRAGSLTDSQGFVQQGGAGVAVDAHRDVCLAAGHISVQSLAGALNDTIETPEPPTRIAFGGTGGRTLFMATRISLHAVRTRVAGR